MRKLYCGGRFYFDYQQSDYRDQAARDFRALLLGHTDLLLQNSAGVELGETLTYIGPFYFESDGMVDRDIVLRESDMIRRCTDAVFLLDEADCPGTVCELTVAAMLGKRVYIFYLQKSDQEETESTLHSPCWYPILHSTLVNGHTEIYPCSSMDDAVCRIRALIQTWRR